MTLFREEDVILVTGASSGIGRAVAMECARHGATVIAQGRNAKRLKEAAESCGNSARWHSEEIDFLESMDHIAEWVKSLGAKYGRMAGLVHSAGLGIMDALAIYNPDQAKTIFDINYHAPLLLAQAFSRKKISRDGASIVFLGSIAGLSGEKGHLTYGASKAALMSAAKSMSQELAPRIRVNCIAPGIVDTAMQQKAEKLMGQEYRKRMLAQYPLGFGKPEDVANLTIFLLSDRARWITGQNIVLDGGKI